MSTTANDHKVSIELTPEMSEVITKALASGEYATGSDIVDEALRQWQSKRTLELQETDELGRFWTKGLASGPGRFGGIEDIKQEARRRRTATPTNLT